MSAEMVYTCDECKRKIERKSPYPAVYAISLRSINIRESAPVAHAVMMYPPIKDKIFCSLGCLGRWVKEEILEGD